MRNNLLSTWKTYTYWIPYRFKTYDKSKKINKMYLVNAKSYNYVTKKLIDLLQATYYTTSTTCQYGCRKYGLVGTVENALGPDAGVSIYFLLFCYFFTR